MRTKTKIWFGIGAVVVASAETMRLGGLAPADARITTQARVTDDLLAGSALAPTASSAILVAQKRQGGEAGEQGGERGAAKLPPDLDFGLKIAQLRGHLIVGDELVKQGQWAAALPHFLHPTEEIYGTIRGRLKDYGVPPFDAALRALSNIVKAKKGGDDYAAARQRVNDALATADQGLRAKQANWDGFVLEGAVELLKSATGEYEEAIVKGRIAKPVEYQDARGFIWQAESMIDSVSAGLEKKSADGLKQVRAGIAELKKAFPAAMPPKTPVKDLGAVLGDVSGIELAAGKLM